MKKLSSAMDSVNWRTSYDGDGDEEEKAIAVGVEPAISITRKKKDIDSMTHDVNLGISLTSMFQPIMYAWA